MPDQTVTVWDRPKGCDYYHLYINGQCMCGKSFSSIDPTSTIEPLESEKCEVCKQHQ